MSVDKRYKDGKYPSCKECHTKTTKTSIIKKWGDMNTYYSEYRNKSKGNSAKNIYTKKKWIANSYDISFNMTQDEFVAWYLEQKQECYYCGIKQEDITKNQNMMPNKNIHRLTLNRLDPNKGYSIDNIVLCCARCNLIKSNFFTPEEMKEIAEKFVKNKWVK